LPFHGPIDFDDVDQKLSQLWATAVQNAYKYLNISMPAEDVPDFVIDWDIVRDHIMCGLSATGYYRHTLGYMTREVAKSLGIGDGHRVQSDSDSMKPNK